MSVRWKFSLTWREWAPMLIWKSEQWPDYASIGIGPAYFEFYWGNGLAPWEQ